jgi:cytochrome P450
MFGYFTKVVLDRRERIASGQAELEDVTAAVLNTSITDIDGVERALTDEELARMFFLLLIAGLHTTQGSLGWMVLHLATNPHQRARIVADPAAVPAAVEEILRFEAQIAMGRRATRDTELGGVTIKEGDQLVLLLCAANRDATQFEQADTLDVARTPNRHLTFGSGPHRCLGSHLARVMLRVAMEELHARIPDYALDPSDPPVILPSQVRGFQRLSITFTPAGS